MIVGHLPQGSPDVSQFKIEDMCETVFAHTAAIRLNVHREPNTSSTKTITDNHSHLMYVVKAVNRTF